MTINIVCEIKPDVSFHYRELAKKVIIHSLDMEKFPYEAEVNLTLTDNQGIHEINREYRDMDRPTDVLSFPMFQKEKIFIDVKGLYTIKDVEKKGFTCWRYEVSRINKRK